MRRLPAVTLVALALAATGVASPSAAQAQWWSAFSANQGQKFVDVASNAIRFSIDAAQLAIARAQSPAVRAYAQQMVADYGAALKDLGQTAQQLSLTMPPTIGGSYATRLTALQVAPAESFDSMYMEAQAKVHKEATYYLGLQTGGTDSPVKQFAARMLPVLNTHGSRLQQFALK
jgi:putative membrane protein